MEFLLYLTPAGKSIYNLISQKVKIVENSPICRQHKIFGWFDSKKNTMILCTDNIISTGEPHHYMNETIYHESVHIAQSCKSSDGYIEPFGISPSFMTISDDKKKDIKNAVSISGPQIRNIEHEALWMEDKPEKVKYVLEKYCF